MDRRKLFGRSFKRLILLGFASCAFAQQPSSAPPQAQPSRKVEPPLFFDENWKQPAVPVSPIDHAWPASPENVSNSSLTLQFYGADAGKVLLSGHHETDTNPLNFWNGICNSPIAVTLRDKENYVDLTGLAKIRWVTRVSGFHTVRPVVKLADGTYLVGSIGSGERTDFNESEISLAEVRWIKLDVNRVVTVGNFVENPDLSKIDEVGYADLLPGSGHGDGGWVNVGHFMVYGKAVKR